MKRKTRRKILRKINATAITVAPMTASLILCLFGLNPLIVIPLVTFSLMFAAFYWELSTEREELDMEIEMRREYIKNEIHKSETS